MCLALASTKAKLQIWARAWKYEGNTVWTVNNVFFYFQALAQIWGCAFVEASAKHRTNVNEVFAEIVREMNLKHSTKDREIVCECCCIS